MDSDEDQQTAQSYNKHHNALRVDLSAALAAFDRAQDWADLIHDLQRVNKVLNKHPPTTILPEKHLLAKRLAQCLTSFLPSGVHLKALETYNLVFTRIGPVRLARDLPLYAGGLFPLLSHCSTSLKAPLLKLYETHLLPLGSTLRPVLDGLVLAILPGLEEESSEFYARSRFLLDHVADAVGDVAIFARALWRALLLSPPVRLAAAHYLRSRLSGGQDDIRAEMVSDMPLVAYAITSALSDENTLTQRSVLDLLMGELALNAPFFECKTAEHRDAAVAVVGGIFGALIRRDMSLTKRVHSWLLGGKLGSEAIVFCKRFSEDLVLAAIDSEIQTSLHTSQKNSKVGIRPMRIAAALVDRDEMCECLGHHLALRILRYGMLAIIKEDNDYERDIRNAIANLMEDLGSARVFAELEAMLADGREKSHADFELLTFALSMFPTRDDRIRKIHLLGLLRAAVQSLNAVSTDSVTLDKAVAFCSRAVLAMDLPREAEPSASLTDVVKATVASFASFFVAWLAHVVEPAPAELRRAYSDVSDAEEYSAELRMAAVHEQRKECISLTKGACSFFVTAAGSGIGGDEVIRSCLQATAKCVSSADVRISLAGSVGFAEVSACASSNVFVGDGNNEQVLGVIRRCWRQVHPSLRTATPQSAQAILRLQSRFPKEMKVVIADGILSQDVARRLRNLERFACLWRLAVEHRLLPLPADEYLFLMLDALIDEDWGPKMLARSWLADALEVDAASVIDAPLRLLLVSESRSAGPSHEFSAVYDAPRALYGFQVLRAILESCPTMIGSVAEQSYALSSPRQISGKDGKRGKTGVRALATSTPTPRTTQMLALVFKLQMAMDVRDEGHSSQADEGPVAVAQLLPAPNYLIAVALACLGYLRGRVADRFAPQRNLFPSKMGSADGSRSYSDRMKNDGEDDLDWILAGLGPKSMKEQHRGVCAAAAECLATLLTSIPVPSQMSVVVSSLLAEPILKLIEGRDGAPDPVLELHYLNAMTFLVTSDGPFYLSSVQGKETFAGADTGRIRLSYSDSQMHLQSLKFGEQSPPRMQPSTVESMDSFVPWLLDGVAHMFGASHGHDSGAQEVLGVQRKWIQFMDTVVRHVGLTLPVVTEGLLLVMARLLEVQNMKKADQSFSNDSEFSRVDETLILLEGLGVVSTTVLSSFEHALANGDLHDNAQETNTRYIQDSNISAHLEPAPTQLSGTTDHVIDVISSQAENANGDAGSTSIAKERVSSATNATVAVMNAINPLRMINDFVKDVLSGAGQGGPSTLLDPRRSGGRLLINLLPLILEHVARVWGPTSEPRTVVNFGGREHGLSNSNGPPRLSTELPRERRQAQRTAALSVIEPLFQLRPADVIAASIALYCKDQDEYGSMPADHMRDIPSRTVSHVLHALEYATPDVVLTYVKTIFEKATKWDRTGTEASEGKTQIELRHRARTAAYKLVSAGSTSLDDHHLEAIGRTNLGGKLSSLAGGTTGYDLSQPVFPTTDQTAASHRDLFHWGDFFAQYSPGVVETACLNFVEHFLLTCTDGDNIQSAWPILHGLFKESVGTSRRKGTVPAVLRVLGAFVAGSPSPFPDRKYRREILTTAVTAISSCASIAAGFAEIPQEEHKGRHSFKKELSIITLQALASVVPVIIDSSFLEDKPQLTSTVATCLTPAISTLKKAAGRAASIQAAAESSRRQRGTVRETSSRHKPDDDLDNRASKSAANVLLQISGRDWGVKFARRELVSLLDDPHFFYGKHGGVLEQMSSIVQEVMASSAAFVLTSVGSGAANGTAGIPNLFVGRDSDAVLRARTIRRIAYCVFVSEPDFYTPQLPTVLEKIRDALRLGNSALVAECLLCLRALLLRTGPSSISAFRATTLSEMFRIASHPTDDLNATLAALKFLDLITLLAPPDFGFERCFFFGEREQLEVEIEGRLKPFTPIATRLASLWTNEQRDSSEIFETPFRLEAGLTVLAGNAPLGFNAEFIGRYAAALQERNSIPKMKAAAVDRDTICREVELEFLM